MRESQKTDHPDHPIMTWVAVTAADGRTRLEARWSVAAHATSAPQAA